MKICLATRYFDYRNAGIGRVSCEIRDGLTAKGHELVCISTDKESLNSYFRYTAIGIRNRIPKGCDIYHSITPMEGIWLPKDKSVITYLDLIPMTHPERAGAGIGYSKTKNLIGQWYFRWAAKQSSKATTLVAISSMTKQYMISRLNVSNVQVIRLGIQEDLKPAAKRNRTLRIGYLGQLDRRKRVDLLISAFKQSQIDAELVIAGTGRDEELLKALAAQDNGSHSNIRFTGFIPNDELCSFYNSLDVFISPTWIEGYGLPIVEAMACRKPVILLSDAILPDEIRSRCIIVDDLTSILSNKEIVNVVKSQTDLNSNLLFAQSHSWEKCVDKYVALYEKIINGGSNND